MLKDIWESKSEVKDIAIAAVLEQTENQEDEWHIYLINLKNNSIEGVLVSSSGFGELGGEMRRTSVLRHFLDEMEAQSFKLIEPIMEDVLKLSNEYWVSFYENKKIYEKRYVFVPDAIRKDFMITIPIINKRGVMLQ
ncbi:MAG: hypothetical protein IPO27_08615 [Bacteroidetes bacterium]|nr:hypothetical protein [Bacteroidota bacterium]